MKKPIFILAFLILLIAGLSVAHVVISNRVSTAGIDLEFLQSEIAKYKKENILIEEKVLEASSLKNIIKNAKKLGFKEPKDYIYLTDPLPLARGN